MKNKKDRYQMVNIFKIKLNSGKIMCIVGNLPGISIAKDQAIKLSTMFFSDDQLYVRRVNEVIEADTGEQALNKETGNIKTFDVAFSFDGAVQNLTIKGKGPMDVYHNLKAKYGIDEDLIVMIFELEQEIVKKDAIELAKQYIKDRPTADRIVKESMVKIARQQNLAMYRQNIKTLMSIFYDYETKRYTDINSEKIPVILAMFMCILNPQEYCINGIQLHADDEVVAAENVTKMLIYDIMNYKQWANGSVGDIIIM